MTPSPLDNEAQEHEQETDWPPPGVFDVETGRAERLAKYLAALDPRAQAAARNLDLEHDHIALQKAKAGRDADAQIQLLSMAASARDGVPFEDTPPELTEEEEKALGYRSLSPEEMAEFELTVKVLSGEISAAEAVRQQRLAPASPARPQLAPGQWAVATPGITPPASTKKKEYEPAGDRIVISTANPYYNAKDFVYRKHTVTGNPTLHYHRGGFYGWDGAAYQESTPQTVRTDLYEYLAECFSRDPEGKLHQVKPNKKMVDDHADALRAASHLDDATEAPAWLEHVPDLPADEMLSCRNGLLHLPTQCLVPHTPLFYTHNALPFSYEANPPEPVQWFRFLDELFPGDQESINTLQEVFGLCLTDDTRHEKAFLIKGPKRSGKGTLGRVLRALIGAVNVAGPTLAQLGGEFGFQPLIGKRVAIISDARLGAKADHAVIAERLLSITGEDALDVNRKNRTFWHGHLKVRFIILTNELPRFTDASGALAGRFIVLRIVPSFYGRENLGLTEALLKELPGILLWSIAGWRRLIERGHFVQPDSAKEDVRIMEDLGSPVSSFLRDRCKIEAGWQVSPTDLYQSWCRWCDGTGRKPGTLETFGRDLRTALPGLKVTQPREDGERHRYYEGIRLL